MIEKTRKFVLRDFPLRLIKENATRRPAPRQVNLDCPRRRGGDSLSNRVKPLVQLVKIRFEEVSAVRGKGLKLLWILARPGVQERVEFLCGRTLLGKKIILMYRGFHIEVIDVI